MSQSSLARWPLPFLLPTHTFVLVVLASAYAFQEGSTPHRPGHRGVCALARTHGRGPGGTRVGAQWPGVKEQPWERPVRIRGVCDARAPGVDRSALVPATWRSSRRPRASGTIEFMPPAWWTQYAQFTCWSTGFMCHVTQASQHEGLFTWPPDPSSSPIQCGRSLHPSSELR